MSHFQVQQKPFRRTKENHQTEQVANEWHWCVRMTFKVHVCIVLVYDLDTNHKERSTDQCHQQG